MTPVERLVRHFVDLALRMGLSVSENPPEFLHDEAKSAMLARNLQCASEDELRSSAAEVEGAQSLFIDNQAVIVSAFPAEDSLSVSAASKTLLKYVRLAAVAMTWLPPDKRENVSVMFVGTPGSATNPDWVDLALQIERDESVCRKMVWLPPLSPDDMVRSLEDFSQRTFLARPWGLGDQNPLAELDPIGRLAAQSPIKKQWIELLSKHAEEKSDTLAELLISSWKSHKETNAEISPRG